MNIGPSKVLLRSFIIQELMNAHTHGALSEIDVEDRTPVRMMGVENTAREYAVKNASEIMCRIDDDVRKALDAHPVLKMFVEQMK